MNAEIKLQKLHALDEKTLRESVLVPLLTKMNFQAVTLYHGPQERGKDIICFSLDQLGGREYLAVVAKASDLDGSVSSSDGLREVLHQVSQCFDVPYADLFGMTQVTMHKVWVITSKRILSGAAESVYASLAKQNLSKSIRFVPDSQLMELIDKHFPEYWDNSSAPIEVLREQKHRLFTFCARLLSSLGAKEEDITATLNQVQNSYFPPMIECPATRSLSRLSPYVVEVDKIADKYSHDFFLYSCGILKESFLQAKQHLYYAMFDVDEELQNYEDVMKLSDPKEFVNGFDKNMSDTHTFRHAYGGRADKAIREIGYLQDGIAEMDELLERLSSVGKLDWATGFVDSVAKLAPDVAEFLSHCDKEQFFLYWKIEDSSGKAILSLHLSKPDDMRNVFETTHERLIKDVVPSPRTRPPRPITVEEVLTAIRVKIQKWFDEQYPPTDPADSRWK